jgi:predicted nucleotide-binding protein (sugar kinase/HSP70/actin superfamily)
MSKPATQTIKPGDIYRWEARDQFRMASSLDRDIAESRERLQLSKDLKKQSREMLGEIGNTQLGLAVMYDAYPAAVDRKLNAEIREAKEAFKLACETEATMKKRIQQDQKLSSKLKWSARGNQVRAVGAQIKAFLHL